MPGPIIYQVSQLTRHIKDLLETRIGTVRVEGEISNFTHHGSGHMYFSLKDASSQISAVMFRGDNSRLKFRPGPGMQIIVEGQISVYERSGNYQLIVRRMDPAGVGALQLAFEQLKDQLAQEGLFDEIHKKPIPFLPARIGVVTSPTGAAIRDIIDVTQRRFGGSQIVLAPVHVQGDQAAPEIAAAIDLFNDLHNVEVLIVGRGGGSLEDLWAFNEENVARAIFKSEIPIISAVGHEIDYTIADFVADLRAPTPSAAAELAVPDKRTLLNTVADLHQRLNSTIQAYLMDARQQHDRLLNSYAFRRPLDVIRQQQQHLDHLNHRLNRAMQGLLTHRQQEFASLVEQLNSYNPLNTLRRGYAICQKLPEAATVTSSTALQTGDRVRLTFHEGQAICEVDSIDSKSQTSSGKT